MLIDPFYIPGAKYSTTSTGIRDLNYGSSYVAAGLSLGAMLQEAGWTVVDSASSVAVQTRPAFYFQVIAPPLPGDPPPVDMDMATCASGAMGAPWRRAMGYNSYDPYKVTPTCGNTAWFEAGFTSADTAANLAAKITSGGVWAVSVTGIIGDISAGGSYEFTFVSYASAFENDEKPISIGGGDGTSKRGFYTLRSPTLGGNYLECKIETRTTNNSGGFFFYDGVGTVKICLTITSSAGGSYYMPWMPGNYNFCGNHHQFAIWPRSGAATRNSNSSLLVSLIEAPEEHLIGGNCPLVIGSNNGDLNTNFDHLRTQLHWSQSLACGHQGLMDDTAYRKGTGGPDGYKTVTMLVRGTKGRPTVSLAGQPLVQAPYVALPANPNSGPEAQIVGKLWDIVTTSGGAFPGARMMHDSKTWECFSTTGSAGDVGCDMWILTDAT